MARGGRALPVSVTAELRRQREHRTPEMIEIAPHFRPPLATLLAVALPLLFAAAILLRREPPGTWRRVVLGAAAAGVLLATASAALWSRRHAGTGTETARGWPRAVHANWEGFGGEGRRSGILWRGALEGAFVYAALAAGPLAAAARRRPAGRRETHLTWRRS